jgi:hypothetical protein
MRAGTVGLWSRRGAKGLAALAGLAAILFPTLLLYPARVPLGEDWIVNETFVGYCGAYFARHHVAPAVYHDTCDQGAPVPLFYGHLMYQVLAVVAARVNPADVLRLAAVGVFAAQFLLVRRALRRQGAGRGLAAAVACLTVWAIYPLTNLYARGALQEFFATGLLTCAACLWFGALAARTAAGAVRDVVAFGLCFVLAAGSHPITAVLSQPLLVLLVASTLPGYVGPLSRARLLGLLAGVGALGAVAAAPWLYACLRFRDTLIATRMIGLVSLDWADNWLVRLFPLPLDTRTLYPGPDLVPTPHLNAQINLPLAALVLVAVGSWLARAGRGRRLRVTLRLPAPALYGALLLVVSVKTGAFLHLPRFFTFFQFGCRLISHIDLSLLLVLLLLGECVRRAGPGRTLPPLVVPPAVRGAALALAGAGVILTLVADYPLRGPLSQQSAKPLLSTPQDRERFITQPGPVGRCTLDYITLDRYPVVTIAEGSMLRVGPLFPVGVGQDLGLLRPAVVRSEVPILLGTRVLAFPGNRFYVDGAPIPPAALRRWDSALVGRPPGRRGQGAVWFAVPVPAGEHTVEVRFELGPGYRLLSLLSRATMLLWAVGLLGLAAGRLLGRSRGAAPSAPAAVEWRAAA